MTTSRIIPTVIATAALALMFTCAFALSATLRDANAATIAPRAVSLSDATYPPHALVMVAPGETLLYPTQCPNGGRFSEVSAYRWNGGALAPQITGHGRAFWYVGKSKTQHMRWDRATNSVTNASHTPLIFAAWCD